MASCLLFHGPGARVSALQKAREIGRLVAPPFGEDGLKVAEAREAMALLLSVPLHQGIGVIVIGPLDETHEQACDNLLKGVEEFRGDVVQPILWARDLGGVPATIRSRCLDTWCPIEEKVIDDTDETPRAAWRLIEAARSGDISQMPEAIKGFKDKDMLRLVNALAEILVTDLNDEKNRRIWTELRKVSQWTNPKPVEILVALMRA